MVIDGKLRQAVRSTTDRTGGGMLLPEDADTKTGRTVIDVLCDKHPPLMISDLESNEEWASFEKYTDSLDCVPVDCHQEAVMEVAAKLQGRAGPCRVDAVQLKKWLLPYGRES